MTTIKIFKGGGICAETGKPWPMTVEIENETIIPNGFAITKEQHSVETEDELVALASLLEYLKSKRQQTVAIGFQDLGDGKGMQIVTKPV